MKRLFTVLAMALMLLVFAWGQAVPVMADEGEEHPWEGDGNNGDTGQYRHARADYYATGSFAIDLVMNSHLLFEDLDFLSKQSSKPTRKISDNNERDTYTDRLKQASIE